MHSVSTKQIGKNGVSKFETRDRFSQGQSKLFAGLVKVVRRSPRLLEQSSWATLKISRKSKCYALLLAGVLRSAQRHWMVWPLMIIGSDSVILSDSEILRDFFSRSYWNRVWVIKEVAVAFDVKILFAGVDMPCSCISSFLEPVKRTEQLQPLFDGALALSHFRRSFSISYQSISLYHALCRSSKPLATDTRDKIFALLGVSRDGPAIVPLPNYKQSLDRILSDVAAEMIREDRSLDIICLRGCEQIPNQPGPSWVPDWLHLWNRSRRVPFLESQYQDWRRSYS